MRQRGYHDKARPLTEDDLVVMHLPQRFWGVSREAIPPETALREKLDAFCDDVPGKMSNPGLSMIVFYGQPDTGKTSGAAIIGKAARSHRYTVYYLDASSLLKTFRDDEPTEDGVLTPRERAYTTDLLILDGLGQGYVRSEFVATETDALIKYRQQEQKMTIITTSVDEDDVERLLGTGFISTVRRTAVMIRCVHNFATGEADGDS